MTASALTPRYKHHRFPSEIIRHGVWRYYRFPLSDCAVQARLLARGSDVTHDASRQWGLQFGQAYANQLKRQRPQPGDTWPLDAVLRRTAKRWESDARVGARLQARSGWPKRPRRLGKGTRAPHEGLCLNNWTMPVGVRPCLGGSR